MKSRFIAPLFICLIALFTARHAKRASAQATQPASQTISASDARFRYEGRFDMVHRNAPVAIWQGSRVGIDFDGDKLALLFGKATGQNYFNATVDGINKIVEIRQGTAAKDADFSGLGAGRHHLMLFKRSEAAAGTVVFDGIQIAADAHAFATPDPGYKLAMEFIGDSITCGACDEDGPADQWDNRRTHNNALSYPVLTAAAFDADYRNIAVSGMGVSAGWVPILAGQIWDRVYPAANSPKADLSKWTPNVVFVNLGENDDSYPKSRHQPFPANFTDNYVSLIHSIRVAYPSAHIVLTRGGMWGGHNSKPLAAAWEAAAKQLESSDKAVSHFAFDHWTSTHPRVPDHKIMADELIAWLKQQDFMK